GGFTLSDGSGYPFRTSHSFCSRDSFQYGTASGCSRRRSLNVVSAMPPLNRRRMPFFSRRYTVAREVPMSAANSVGVSTILSGSLSGLRFGLQYPCRSFHFLTAAGDLGISLFWPFLAASISSGNHLRFSSHGSSPFGSTLLKNCLTASMDRPSSLATTSMGGLVSASVRAHSRTSLASFVDQRLVALKIADVAAADTRLIVRRPLELIQTSKRPVGDSVDVVMTLRLAPTKSCLLNELHYALRHARNHLDRRIRGCEKYSTQSRKLSTGRALDRLCAVSITCA